RFRNKDHPFGATRIPIEVSQNKNTRRYPHHPMNKTIIDNFGRVHNYLRISLTDRCNLRCFYCMPEWKHTFAAHQKLMQAGEIETLARIFVENGVNKIRLTGGEPL